MSTILKTRLIPVVIMKNGVVVQSKGFKRFQVLGNPFTIVQRLSAWTADELIYLDISRTPVYDLKRDDLNFPNRNNIIDILRDIAEKSFMPLTFGGGIRTLEDVRIRLNNGADKVTINSMAFKEPTFITKVAEEFGSQSIVVSIDARKTANGNWEIFKDWGQISTGQRPSEWAAEMEQMGAGEILINSIDRDGSGKGYDIELLKSVMEAVNIPVIACGGVGTWEHLAECIHKTNVSAAAAANIFHYSENSVYAAKKYLYDKGFNVRKPVLEKDCKNL